MTRLPPQPLRAALAVLALATLAGCKTAPTKVDPNAAPAAQASEGRIRMPAGADYRRVVKAEKGEKLKILVRMRGVGDPANEKLLFPAQVAASIGVTPVQVQRSFRDVVGRSRRYEVYDDTFTGTAEATDFLVDAQVVGTTQELRRLEGGARVAVTRVRVNAMLLNPYDGKPIWDAPVEAVGETGTTSGDRVTLLARESEQDPAVQNRLGVDYQHALERAFDDVARRIELALRPMGKVLRVDGDTISMIGGRRNGLQGGDEMVVFQAGLTRIGAETHFEFTRPVLAVRCDGVGEATSQCDIIRRDPKLVPKAGDFVVLTDHSAVSTRMRH